MNFDLSSFVSLIESRIGRRSTTILAWLVFVVTLTATLEFLIGHVVIPLEKFFGGTGDLRADLMSGRHDPFWPALVATLFVLSGSVVLFIPFINVLIGTRRVPQAILNDLEERRSWAIHNVLNFFVQSAEEWEEWQKRNNQFISEVTAILEAHCTKADVLRFTRLGVITTTPFGFAYSPQHQHGLMMLAKRLDTLERIVDRYMR